LLNILSNKLWPGYCYNETVEFIMPRDYDVKGKGFIDEKGLKHGFVPKICWLTNLDVNKRHEDFILTKKYDESIYHKYDNFDAIEVKEANNIPKNYYGMIGVPISFLDRINPDQFELIGSSDIPDTLPGIKKLGPDWIKKYKAQGGTGHYTANMKSVGYSADGKYKIVYSRLIIKNKR